MAFGENTQSGLMALEAEQAVLGALMFDNDLHARIADRVEPEDFYDPIHRMVFEAIDEMIRAGRAATPVTLHGYLAPVEGYGKAGGKDYLERCCSMVPASAVVADYAAMIADAARRRGLHAIGQELMSRAAAPAISDTAVKQAQEAEEALFELAARDKGTQGMAQFLGYGSEGWFSEVENPDSAIRGITTGLKELDKITGGLKPAELIIVGARPSQGKTTLATNMIRSAMIAGAGVFFPSLEMSRQELWRRMLADLAREHSTIQYNLLGRQRFYDEEANALRTADDLLRAFPLIVDDRAGLSAAQIAAGARRAQKRLMNRGAPLGLIVVDYLQLMKVDRAYAGNLSWGIGQNSQALKQLAKDLNVPVVALCQLSRKVEERADKRPSMADLRQSGEIENDADIITFLLRPEYYLEKEEPEGDMHTDKYLTWRDRMDKAKGKMKLFVDKNRNGPCGAATAWCDMGCNAIRDLDYRFGSGAIFGGNS